MMHKPLTTAVIEKFSAVYGSAPSLLAYAPGRVEVLGNHTDYNEGRVLSAAIDRGTGFALRPRRDAECRLTAGDLMRTIAFSLDALTPRTSDTWANYVIGVLAGLAARKPFDRGFDALFFSDLPLGAGLSSSAALEMSAALALQTLNGVSLDRLSLARIGQAAEHQFAGVKCGLLDQVTSLFGRAGSLVMTDFRTLDVTLEPFPPTLGLLMCNTHAKHALVDGAYNARRHDCERAVAFFAERLDHPVTALRDVSRREWEAYHAALEPRVARRALHPIGEIERVAEGASQLRTGDVAGFGALMFDSHESSRQCFENSCPELDCLVERARELPGVLGARLSGGGFGGSVVVLLRSDAADTTAAALRQTYAARFGQACDTRLLACADGARLLD